MESGARPCAGPDTRFNTDKALLMVTEYTTLDYPKDISITELVKRIRDAGYTSGNAYIPFGGDSPWLNAPESEIAELKQALETVRCHVLSMSILSGITFILIRPRKQQSLKYMATACETAERVGCPMITTHAGTKSTEACCRAAS